VRTLVTVAFLALIATGAALAASGDPQKHYTPADTAKAKNVVLKLSDLPAGWAGKKSTGSGGHLQCKSFKPDESDLVKTGNADSYDFSKGLYFIESSASIFRSAAQAQASWDRVVRPGLLTCLRSIFEQGASSGAATTTATGQGALAFPKLAPRTAAFRITFQTKSGSQTLNGDIDVVLLGRNRIDAVMLFVGFGTPNGTLEQHLAGVVAARMR
jgi:hypothetical protein